MKTMILRLSYEEVTALNEAAERILEVQGRHVVAPPAALAGMEPLLPLDGDVSVETLGEQRQLMAALGTLLDHAKHRMDGFIVDGHVGSEESVVAFFEYANVLAARAKLEAIGHEMKALIEVMTVEETVEEEEILFPD